MSGDDAQDNDTCPISLHAYPYLIRRPLVHLSFMVEQRNA